MNRPSVIRNAATVMLLRDSPRGLEVLLMRRHLKSDFVGGAYVFPGGIVEPGDAVEDSLVAGATEQEASRILGIERGGLTYWAAAIRECFEESGILLAQDARGDFPDFSDRSTLLRFTDHRNALQHRRTTLADILRQEQLRLAITRVHYWSHWITPRAQPRRYDTRFFLTLAPRSQTALHDGIELTDSEWISPARALEKAERGEWTIIFPTRKNLQSLKVFPAAAVAEAAAIQPRRIILQEPVMERLGDRIRIFLPGEEESAEWRSPDLGPGG